MPHTTKVRSRRSSLVATWFVLMFMLAGQVSATYEPVNKATLLPSTKLIDLVTAPTKVVAKKDLVDLTKPVPDPTFTSTKTLSPQSQTPSTPEVTIEIKAAEYVPPKFATYNTSGPSDFPYGQCTYYVATKRPISWGGNAGYWYEGAQAAGMRVGATPAVGAIMVSFEGSSAGHVAYVESVNADGSFKVSEMNYSGNWGRITSRTLRLGDTYIVGFIY